MTTASASTIRAPVDDWEFDVLDIYNYRKPGKFDGYFAFLRANHARVRGDVCEVGVYRGRSLLSTALLLRELGSDKIVWGYDSFSGFPGYHPNDDLSVFERLYSAGRVSEGHIDAVRRNIAYREMTSGRSVSAGTISSSGDFSKADVSVLRRKVELLGLENVRLVEGPFERTMAANAGGGPERLCAALMDCDLYESHRAAMPFVWRVLEPGGLVFLDEYYSLKFPGARLAIDEFFASRAEKPEMHEHKAGEFERWSVRKGSAGEKRR